MAVGQQLPMQGAHPLLQALRGSEGKASGRVGRKRGEKCAWAGDRAGESRPHPYHGGDFGEQR